MKSVCTSFLKAALRDTIVKLIESKQSCELNPTKMDSPEDACNNAEFLLQVSYFFPIFKIREYFSEINIFN